MRWPDTQKLIDKYYDLITQGTYLVIDPSSGSYASMPGWAVYSRGELTHSGIIRVSLNSQFHERLREIADWVRKLQDTYRTDLVVIESNPSIKGFWGKSVDALLMGTGAIMSAVQVDKLLEIRPIIWKKSVTEDYVKSDENDAIWLGRFVLLEAHKRRREREVRAEKPRRAPSTRKVKLDGKSKKQKKHSRALSKKTKAKARTSRGSRSSG